MKLDATSILVLVLLAAVQVSARAAPAVQTTPAAAVSGDPTGLVGKTVMIAKLPKGSSEVTYGNDYYLCTSNKVGTELSEISIAFLRKGIKNKCPLKTGKMTVALKQDTVSDGSSELLDAMKINVPKGYEISQGCTGADLAISKYSRSARTINHLQAWEVVNNKFAPVANLKAISCTLVDND